MSIVVSLIKGALSVITVTAAPQLYRYPYRSSAEGLRGDMQRVGGDVEAVFERLGGAADGKRRRDHE